MRRQIYCTTSWTTGPDNKNEYPHGWGFDFPLVCIWEDELDNNQNELLNTISTSLFPNGEFVCYCIEPKDIFDLTMEF